MSFFFIHGFANNLTHIFQPLKVEECDLFPAIRRIVPDSQFHPFLWGKDRTLRWWELPNLSHIFHLYRKERSISLDRKLLERKARELQEARPKVILAHSMGCHLLLNYVRTFGLPDFVEKIIFFQADIDFNVQLPESLAARLRRKQLQMYNFYCFWDDSLLISSLLHLRVRAGNWGLRNHGIKNIHFPLGRARGPVHNSPLSSKRFTRSLTKILNL